VVCTFAALTDYHFWARTWWVWFGLAVVTLGSVSSRRSGCASMARDGGSVWRLHRTAVRDREGGGRFFLAWWFTQYEKRATGCCVGFVFPLGIICVSSP
jgi:hypothetical protein